MGLVVDIGIGDIVLVNTCSNDGAELPTIVGLVDTSIVGESLGISNGANEGSLEGIVDGMNEGMIDGL